MTVSHRSITVYDRYTGDIVADVFLFPGGEPHVNLTGAASEYIIDVRGGSFKALGAALVVNDALRQDPGCTSVELFIPYLPGARQDRGAPLTAKVYADVINQAEFDRVWCIDPHSDVMPALIDNLTIMPHTDIIPPELFNTATNPFLICPDAGAVKRTEAVAAQFGLDVFYARKYRDFATGKLEGFSCESLPPGTGIIIDDICDGGGTFLGLAEIIDKPRTHLRLWTTHGIYSKGLTDLEDAFGMIGCTDSFPSGQHPTLTVAVRHPALFPDH